MTSTLTLSISAEEQFRIEQIGRGTGVGIGMAEEDIAAAQYHSGCIDGGQQQVIHPPSDNVVVDVDDYLVPGHTAGADICHTYLLRKQHCLSCRSRDTPKPE